MVCLIEYFTTLDALIRRLCNSEGPIDGFLLLNCEMSCRVDPFMRKVIIRSTNLGIISQYPIFLYFSFCMSVTYGAFREAIILKKIFEKYADLLD